MPFIRQQCAARTVLVRAVLALGSLFASGAVRPDTIVLKNGHRIEALEVVETGDKIKYQTSVGELSIPKSIVDHIEKGGPRPGGRDAATLSITPPAMIYSSGAREIEHLAVHDGGIDREYIAKLEGEARAGGTSSRMNAAVAHHSAAMFELYHGDTDHALVEERTALTYAPEDSLLLMDVAYLHLRRSEFKQSLNYLDRARRVAPDNPDVAKLAGWAYYGLNKPDQAVKEWQQALALRPDAEVRVALEKARRDKQEEQSYKENESSHFTLRYSGTENPGLARDILRTLEAHYAAIESALNYSPPDSIGVILYTQEAFTDVTRAPGWVAAVNDGRLRVPVQGLTSITEPLSRVLKHELTHSFVQQKTHGRSPTWLQEGLAQFMEGRRSNDSASALLQIYGDGHASSLGSLEGSWMAFPSDSAAYAYAWALANIEYIVQDGGLSDVERLLDRIAAGNSAEDALRDVLHSNYDDMTRSTAEYLRKAYIR